VAVAAERILVRLRRAVQAVQQALFKTLHFKRRGQAHQVKVLLAVQVFLIRVTLLVQVVAEVVAEVRAVMLLLAQAVRVGRLSVVRLQAYL
jgi:hypothetical protein